MHQGMLCSLCTPDALRKHFWICCEGSCEASLVTPGALQQSSVKLCLGQSSTVSSGQWCFFSNTLAKMDQGLVWCAKALVALVGGQWIAHVSLEIEQVRPCASTHTHTHWHTSTFSPALKEERGTAMVQQPEPWPSGSSLDEAHLSLLSPNCSYSSPFPPSQATTRSVWLTLYLFLYPHLVT